MMRIDRNGLRSPAATIPCLALLTCISMAHQVRAGDTALRLGQSHPGAKTVRLEPVLDSLEADMLGLLAGAGQGRVSSIKGEHYVRGFRVSEVKELGEEDKRILQSRLTSTAFKLKLEENSSWEKISRNIDREIANYLVTKKIYRILAEPDTAIDKKDLAVSACLRLTDTVYVWTPGCNCPKPKSSALATCAVVLDARAVDAGDSTAWHERELLFYVGLEESIEEAFSSKRIKKYVRNAFGSFR